jgi:hypothetical protein
VADTASAETANETLRVLFVLTGRLLPVLVRELTEPTSYVPDGDEGDGGDTDLQERLMGCIRSTVPCTIGIPYLNKTLEKFYGIFDGPFLAAMRAISGKGELRLGAG